MIQRETAFITVVGGQPGLGWECATIGFLEEAGRARERPRGSETGDFRDSASSALVARVRGRDHVRLIEHEHTRFPNCDLQTINTVQTSGIGMAIRTDTVRRDDVRRAGMTWALLEGGDERAKEILSEYAYLFSKLKDC